MNVRNVPATALPWVGTCLVDSAGAHHPAPGVVSEEPGTVNGYKRVARAGNPSRRCRQDMRYIVHSGNAYPELVLTLQALEQALWLHGDEHVKNLPAFRAAGELLRKLEERQ